MMMIGKYDGPEFTSFELSRSWLKVVNQQNIWKNKNEVLAMLFDFVCSPQILKS